MIRRVPRSPLARIVLRPSSLWQGRSRYAVASFSSHTKRKRANYVERGLEEFEVRSRDRLLCSIQRKAKRLGLTLSEAA